MIDGGYTLLRSVERPRRHPQLRGLTSQKDDYSLAFAQSGIENVDPTTSTADQLAQLRLEACGLHMSL